MMKRQIVRRGYVLALFGFGAAGTFSLFIMCGCRPVPPPTAHAACNPDAQTQSPSPVAAPSWHEIKCDSVPNLYRLDSQIFSGAQPEGDAGFEQLARMGVRTIITVDGAKPDLETARRHGLRYVHLPIEYGGIDHTQAIRLVKAAQQLQGPIYIHCHHGQHRGPAAAAIIEKGVHGWSADRARAWMHAAGTSPHYAGLYADVAAFKPPTPAELAAASNDFLPIAPVSKIVEVMDTADHHWEVLRAGGKIGFAPLPEHPDIDFPHEALLLHEQFQELVRMDAASAKGRDFIQKLEEARLATGDLEQHLRLAKDDDSLHAAMRRVGQSCKSCHIQFRD